MQKCPRRGWLPHCWRSDLSRGTHHKQLTMRLNKVEQAVVGSFVLGELALVRNADGLAPARRDAVGPVGHAAVAVVEVEEARREADRQVRCGHLVVVPVARHVIQKIEQRLQGFAVLIGQQQEDALHRVRP